MSDDYPPRPFVPNAPGTMLPVWPRFVIYPLLIVVVIILIVPALLGQVHQQARKAEARNSDTALTAGLKAYFVEYGHWPDFTGDGLFLDEPRQGQLMRVLLADDVVDNPRKIIFFEARDVTETSGKYRGGFNPKTDVLYDPWGQPYRIALDTTGTGTIANPYPDDGPISASVLVWSLGKDGQQGAPANPHTAQGSDDILSWQ